MAEFVRRTDALMNARQRAEGDDRYLAIWDQLAMAVAIDPQVTMATRHLHMVIETAGHWTRGQCVVDWQGRLGKEPNVTLVTEINQERFEKLLFEGLQCYK